MSFSLVSPGQWNDFESLLDNFLVERYGSPSNGRKRTISSGTGSVSKIMRPNMDIVENDNAFILTAELPGAKKEDIAIELQNDRLHISGQIKSSSQHSEGNVRVSERSFGSFARTLAVPTSVTPDQIKASFKDGVLEVNVPKVKNSQSKTINIS